MANESRLSITIDSRNAEQKAKDLQIAVEAMDAVGIRVSATTTRTGQSALTAGALFSTAGSAARQGAGDVDRLSKSFDASGDRAATAAATINRTLRAAFAGFSAMKIIDTADQWGQHASRLKMATQSADEYNQVQDRMVQSAQTTFRSINETKESFIQMSPILRGMGLSLGQSMDAIDAFSGLLVVNAASGDCATRQDVDAIKAGQMAERATEDGGVSDARTANLASPGYHQNAALQNITGTIATIVLDCAGMAARHGGLASRFATLLSKVVEAGDAEVCALRREYHIIEADEPPSIRGLVQLCQDEQDAALGNHVDSSRFSLHRRVLAQFGLGGRAVDWT
ncbi:MAG TPA: tape measure protein [Castellaniella sp.]|uniref:tape measure protein n=1 Tax=Castellaniella sp. TaxID=1955812 RepID=UPI002F14C7CD